MSFRQTLLVVALATVTVFLTETALDLGVRALSRPRILAPRSREEVRPPVVLTWTGPAEVELYLRHGGGRQALGTARSPAVIPAELFPAPGRYGVELRARRLGRWVTAERVFTVVQAKSAKDGAPPLAQAREAGSPLPTEEPIPRDALMDTLNGLYAAYRAVQKEKRNLESELEELHAECDRMAADLEQAAAARAELEERIAFLEEEAATCAAARDQALAEVRLLRERLAAVPACAAWGYVSFPPTGTTPPRRRLFVINDPRGRLFSDPADCERTRLGDPTARTRCSCVIEPMGAPASGPSGPP